MKFNFAHCNLNVLHLDASLDFYKTALGLKEARRIETESFTIVYLTDDADVFRLELTCLADRVLPYDLGSNESHIAFVTDDFDAAHALHKQMGCICYENTDMGVYFINDPDGYWLEIVPVRD